MKSIKSVILILAVGGLLASCSLSSESSSAQASSGTSSAPATSSAVPPSTSAPATSSAVPPSTSAPIPSSVYTPGSSENQGSSNDAPAHSSNATSSSPQTSHTQDYPTSAPASSSAPGTTQAPTSTNAPASHTNPTYSSVASAAPDYEVLAPEVGQKGLVSALVKSLSKDKIAFDVNINADGYFAGKGVIAESSYESLGSSFAPSQIIESTGEFFASYTASLGVEGLRGDETADLKASAIISGEHSVSLDAGGDPSQGLSGNVIIHDELYFGNNVAYLDLDQNTVDLLAATAGFVLPVGKTSIAVGEGGPGVMPIFNKDVLSSIGDGFLSALVMGQEYFPSINYYRDSYSDYAVLPVNGETVSTAVNLIFGDSPSGRVYASLAKNSDFGDSFISILYGDSAITGAYLVLDFHAEGTYRELYGEIAEAELVPELANAKVIMDANVGLGIQVQYDRSVYLPDSLDEYVPMDAYPQPEVSATSIYFPPAISSAPAPSRNLSHKEFVSFVENEADPNFTGVTVRDSNGYTAGPIVEGDAEWENFNLFKITDDVLYDSLPDQWDTVLCYFSDGDTITIDFYAGEDVTTSLDLPRENGFRYPSAIHYPAEDYVIYLDWGYAGASESSEPRDELDLDWLRDLVAQQSDPEYTAVTLIDAESGVEVHNVNIESPEWESLVANNYCWRLNDATLDKIERDYASGTLDVVEIVISEGRIYAHFLFLENEGTEDEFGDEVNAIYDIDHGYCIEGYETFNYAQDPETHSEHYLISWGYFEGEASEEPSFDAIEYIASLIVGLEDPGYQTVTISMPDIPDVAYTVTCNDSDWEGNVINNYFYYLNEANLVALATDLKTGAWDDIYVFFDEDTGSLIIELDRWVDRGTADEMRLSIVLCFDLNDGAYCKSLYQTTNYASGEADESGATFTWGYLDESAD